MNSPTGWIEPKDRTQEQTDAHEAALATMPNFAVGEPLTRLAKGENLVLGKFWSDPRVVQDVGFVFSRFHQLTGSCVGASDGNMLFTLIAIQRCLAENPTKAFVPFWLFNYGRGRLLGGMRGQGEGSIDSYQIKQNMTEGVIDWATVNDPKFASQDGLVVSSSTEMKWSDGRTGESMVTVGRQHPLGTAAPVNDTDSVYQGLINGYPYLFGCSRFVGSASIKGSGKDVRVVGKFDSSGGHSVGIIGVRETLNDGTEFLMQNNWPKSVYPADPQNECPPCSAWVSEAELAKTWASFQGRNEGFLLSHLNWFPAQPELLDYVY